MSYFTQIWRSVATSLKGMSIVFGHIPTRKVTRGYPEPKNEYILPERARNRLYVNMDDCIGCDQCARACPVNCITIDTVKTVPGEDLGVTSNGKKKALWVTGFDIDMAKCCFCSLCVWPCPTDCIVMTETFEYSELVRENFIYHFATMDAAEAQVHESNWKKWEVEANVLRAKQAAERAAKTAAATAATAAANSSNSDGANTSPGSEHRSAPPYLKKPSDEPGNPGSGSSKSPEQTSQPGEDQ
jgi:formate hydrogenlyase subunit 6/NADH:ubiquinone oxidoreductase subunit I